jgi:hypothetical protein
MKFYIDKINRYFWGIIFKNKLTAIYNYSNKLFYVHFFKNGKRHNSKNAAYINGIYKSYYLNGESCGYEYNFTKKSWRRFVKMQTFL